MNWKAHCITWWNAAAEVLFPARCNCCGVAREVGGGSICAGCLAEVPYCLPPLCLCCGGSFAPNQGTSHYCETCLRKPPPYVLARAITFYEEPVRTLLHRLKYAYDTTALGPLLEIARSFDISRYDVCDCILPVPIHGRRLRQRGMNQALTLARGIFGSRKSDILPGVLVKTVATVSQTELDGRGRRRSLKSAFAVKNPVIIKEKRVCLVDDIFTTGTTVAECSRTLRRGGAKEVHVLTFSRVRHGAGGLPPHTIPAR